MCKGCGFQVEKLLGYLELAELGIQLLQLSSGELLGPERKRLDDLEPSSEGQGAPSESPSEGKTPPKK